MKLKLIRAVDKWVGIPACFFVSLGHKALAFWKGRKRNKSEDSAKPEKILFIELSEMGSAILAYPAIRYTLAKYPEARLYFLIFEQNRFSVDILGIVPPENVITIDPRSPLRFIFSTFKAFMSVQEAGIDTVFDLELFSRFTSLLSSLSGASRRVGYGRYREEGLYRGGHMTHRVFYNCHQHMSKNFLSLVKALEHQDEFPLSKELISDGDLVPPRYRSSQEDLDVLRERLSVVNPVVHDSEFLILFNPGAGKLLPIRAWPAENYVALGQRVIENLNAAIVLIGLDEARHRASIICEQIGKDRCIDFTGKTTFKDLMDLLNLADLLVTADAGPAHFAALTDIRNIVLFGPETPELYSPLGPKTTCFFAGFSCSPCLSAYNHRDTRCSEPLCMSAITVEEVYETLSETLKAVG